MVGTMAAPGPFSAITADLQASLRSDLAQIRFLLKKSPALGYTCITEKGRRVGERYGIRLVVNFPHEGKIDEYEMYGRRDLSLIIDQKRTRFPICRELIKRRAGEIIGGVRTEDAYMYEGKEGVRLLFENGRMDILPHSVHLWCEFTAEVTRFCDWLLAEAYLMGRERG